MKNLTQAVFDDAPSWAKSAAVDADGYAYFYQDRADLLILHERTFTNLRWGTSTKSLGGGYDATNWRESAINRGE